MRIHDSTSSIIILQRLFCTIHLKFLTWKTLKGAKTTRLGLETSHGQRINFVQQSSTINILEYDIKMKVKFSLKT